MSKMISNHKGMQNGFCLINNYIVDSKMFEIVSFLVQKTFLIIKEAQSESEHKRT